MKCYKCYKEIDEKDIIILSAARKREGECWQRVEMSLKVCISCYSIPTRDQLAQLDREGIVC